MESAWRRYLWWDLMYVVISLLTAALSAVSARTDVRRTLVVALVVAIFAGYALIGRRLVRAQPVRLWRELAFNGLMIALYLCLAIVSDGAPLMLMMLGSLVFWLGNTYTAVAAALVLNGCTILGSWIDGRDALGMVPLTLAIAAIMLVSGSWSRSIVRQSVARADLIRELQASRVEVARLSREAERQRVAADIHDTLAQGFGSIVMLAQALRGALDRDSEAVVRHLDLIESTARDNLAEARAIVGAMRPPVLDGGLEEALRRVAGSFPVTVAGDPRALAPPVAVVLLRVGQEALNNARKHGGDTAAIGLSFEESVVRLTVADSGPGFDVAALEVAGFGLAGMRGRVVEVGGDLSVTSRPGETVVSVEVPG